MTRMETRRLRHRPGWSSGGKARPGSTRREIIGRIGSPRLCCLLWDKKSVTTFARFSFQRWKRSRGQIKERGRDQRLELRTSSTRDRRSRQADRQRDGTVVFAGFRRDHGARSGAAWGRRISPSTEATATPSCISSHRIRKEENKKRLSFPRCPRSSSFGFTYALFFYSGDASCASRTPGKASPPRSAGATE